MNLGLFVCVYVFRTRNSKTIAPIDFDFKEEARFYSKMSRIWTQ